MNIKNINIYESVFYLTKRFDTKESEKLLYNLLVNNFFFSFVL